MSKWIIDIEANGLHDCDRMWVIHGYNFVTDTHKYWLEGDLSWKEELGQAKLIVGHNIISYDKFVLKRLFDFDPADDCMVHDTMLLSLILNYKRFGKQGHSLDNWGALLRKPKMDWLGHLIKIGFLPEGATKADAFAQWHPDMLDYVKQDVIVTYETYKILLSEFKTTVAREPNLKPYVQAEHYVAEFCSEAKRIGWPFDLEGAKALLVELERTMNLAYDALSANLGYKCVPLDKVKGIVESKRPRWTKHGLYDARMAEYFGVDPISGLDDPELNACIGHRQIQGEYSRVSFPALDLNSIQDVKIFLFRNGWEPTSWNYKMVETEGFNGKPKMKREKTSPKITEDSLECLGGNAKLYVDFLVARSRHSIVKTWIENTDSDGMLHGDCMTIGTPSMRMRHSVIVNVPSGDVDKAGNAVSEWGPEMRALFRVYDGWKQVGCDSAGNQVRGLAHYLEDKDFIELLLHGDIHQRNADTLTEILLEVFKMTHEVPRPRAKRILYAFLFGAGGDKLWSYVFDVFDKPKGNKLKTAFIKAVPGLSELLDKLAAIYASTAKRGEGYIYGIAGNRLYVDSLHKLLVYLLQACEKATCGCALMYAMRKFKEEKIPYIPLIFMHDEFQVMTPEKYADRVLEIGVEAFREGPKMLGVTIMDGDGKIGKNWLDCH